VAGRRPKILWSKLKPATQKRKLNFYKKQGLSDSSIRAKYNTGTLGPQSAARGHATTPERPTRAVRNPLRYQKYIERRTAPATGPQLSPRDLAYIVFTQLLGDYLKFNPKTVKVNVYEKMSDADIAWLGQQSGEDGAEAIRAKARIQKIGNPFYYH
jgi:hypothetical protein